MNEWKCSDPDCAQYYKQLDDFTFSFIEVREAPLNQYMICHTVIDLRDYGLDELWNYCEGYYDSFEQMVSDYGFREALQVMAECVFEQLPFYDMIKYWNAETIGKAIKFVHEWIGG